MTWTLDSDRPLYTQLAEKISSDIASGLYQPGEKLPSVRDFAIEAAVNPNTMQKAFTELERMGLVFSKRTSGRFITEDVTLINSYKKKIADGEISNFLTNMKRLGYNKEQTIACLQEFEED